MRAKLIGCVVVLLAAGAVAAQSQVQLQPQKQPPPTTKQPETKKSELEQAIEDALKHSPDVRVAAAKVAEAEAQLDRARAEVLRKVLAAYHKIQQESALADEYARRAAAMDRLRKQAKGSVTDDDYFATLATAASYRAKAEAARSELDFLTGKLKYADKAQTAPTRSPYVLDSYKDRQAHERRLYADALRRFELLAERAALDKAPIADRLRKAMAKKATFALKERTPRDFLDAIKEVMGGLHVQANVKDEGWVHKKMNVTLTDVPLSVAFQLLEDSVDGHRIVVRDYGLLIAPADKLPPNAVTLADFLRPAPTKEKGPTETTARPEAVEGLVTEVNNNLLKLSIGADAGLSRGVVLDVLRLTSKDGRPPAMLGTVRVVEVTPTVSVAEVVKVSEAVRVGDVVTTVRREPQKK
jgi:hypothetical protein